MIRRGRKTAAIQVNGKPSENSNSRGRITFRQAKIAPGIIASDHGNHQTRCIQTNCSAGTPLSLPGTLEKERRCPNHSTRNSCSKNPGKCSSVATYQGTNSATKIDIYPQWNNLRKRSRTSRKNAPSKRKIANG